MAKRKIIIASNRLPVKVTKKDGELVFSQSSGGLATAMDSLGDSKSEMIWVGWPGIGLDDLTAAEKKEITKELKKRGCHPVFLTNGQVDKFYLGYSNAVLWPLFHYFPRSIRHKAELWDSYKAVNQLFANEIAGHIRPDSLVWVHDYHLMLAPAILRKKKPQATIGFFLHTPFPSYEIFRLLPERNAVLHGLLGADLVGFHTYDYVRHFLSSVLRLLGYESRKDTLTIKGRKLQADAFPISVDYKNLAGAARTAKVKQTFKTLVPARGKPQVILSVDRGDYSKGILERLEAFEHFLAHNPNYHGKVSLIQIVAPSREHVDSYKELLEEIERRTSHINGTYSTVDWMPITYIHKSLPSREVLDLYYGANVMLVTPLRDGMNLVAKEYVASRLDSGVLILSEMTGAASELLEAIQVNPHHTPTLSAAIKQALEMPKKEQKRRLKRMQSRIKSYSVHRWADDFISRLESATEARQESLNYLSQTETRQIAGNCQRAKNRLILLDYDGTLVNFVNNPSRLAGRPPKNVQNILGRLADDDNNTVVIVSGRPKAMLTSWFKNERINLVAEHGGWVKYAGSWAKKRISFKKWKRKIKPVLDRYADRTPGAVVEEKEFALVWHYRGVSPDLAYTRKRELKNELRSILTTPSIGIYNGQKILEVKPKAIHKGEVVQRFLAQADWDFMLVMGDDYTDEDMFAAAQAHDCAHTVKVGSGATRAKYRASSVKDALGLLHTIYGRR